MIKFVGNTKILDKHIASCHCGLVKLELTLPNGIEKARRCNCSICRRKGAIIGAVSLNGVRIIEGEDALSLYQFNTNAAIHYFCANCGIYTHHQLRSNPNEYGFNIGCLEGVNSFDLPDVITSDGANHLADR